MSSNKYMVRRPGLLLLPGFLAAICAFGQIGIPGQYQIPIVTFDGTLRRVGDVDLVVQSDDKRVVTISLANSTRYFKASGGIGKRQDLQPGDRVSVDATEDTSNYYHATRVTQIRPGTSEERAAASSGIPAGNSGVADADSAPPALRAGSSNATAPRLDDSAPVPRPSIHAEDVNGVTRRPAPPRIDAGPPGAGGRISMPGSGDPVIDRARQEAFSFAETLPNYVVKQFTTRYETAAARGGQTSWQAIDNVTADVVSEDGKETYKNILIDGKPPKEAVEKTGSWSTGEYSSVLLDVLQPATDADFHDKRSTTIVNRAAFRCDFSVEQPNSHWHIFAGGESYIPEYTGVIWIDKENFRVLRLELAARKIPVEFPLDTVESAIDYDFVAIGGSKFLLPVHSESLSCARGTSICTRNVIDFRNYRKFGADSSITFEPTP